MKQINPFLTLLAVLLFTYLSGAVLFNALQNLQLTSGPQGVPAFVDYVIKFSLGIPVTLCQLAAMKYAKNLFN